jgi:hypothetical protein
MYEKVWIRTELALKMDIQMKISRFSGEKKDLKRGYITFLAKDVLRGY